MLLQRVTNAIASTKVRRPSRLRILHDDGSTPADNPFFAQGGNLAKYYAYGVRNSFGLAFDPVTGVLWDTENGPSNYDEINLVLPGFNSGWNKIITMKVRANTSSRRRSMPGSC